eukprot:scaffold17114_cov41-Phaeocystis_antarctica.AAC.1
MAIPAMARLTMAILTMALATLEVEHLLGTPGRSPLPASWLGLGSGLPASEAATPHLKRATLPDDHPTHLRSSTALCSPPSRGRPSRDRRRAGTLSLAPTLPPTLSELEP